MVQYGLFSVHKMSWLDIHNILNQGVSRTAQLVCQFPASVSSVGHSADINTLCPALGHREFTSSLCLLQTLCPNQNFIFSLCRLQTIYLQQWWIQDFPEEGALTPKGGVPTYYSANFSQKLHENEEILGQRGGHASLAPPLRPATVQDISTHS